MSNDSVFEFKNPGVSNAVRDTLTDVVREGARELLAQAIEAEVVEFLEQYRSEQDKTGRSCMVRKGCQPARTIQTGIVCTMRGML